LKTIMAKRETRSRRDPSASRLGRMRANSLKPPIAPDPDDDEATKNFTLDCGWGRLLFAQTFDSAKAIADATRSEGPDRRDIVFYVREPHVVLAAAPQELFLDPSHTFRLDLSLYRSSARPAAGFFVRRLTAIEDAEAINRIYQVHNMVPVPPDFF
jgi:hypothetical protein